MRIYLSVIVVCLILPSCGGEDIKATVPAEKEQNAVVTDPVPENANDPQKEFLTENAKREEVTVLPDGLQYEVIREGNGPKPTMQNKVKTHYHGTLIDGTVFDSSVDRGEPIEFNLSQVIRGWQEGIQLMSEGSKYKLYVPAELGYGSTGRPGIPPNSTLIFDVELIEIK